MRWFDESRLVLILQGQRVLLVIDGDFLELAEDVVPDDPVIFPDARYYYPSGQHCVADSESNTHNRYGTASSQSRAVNFDLWAGC